MYINVYISHLFRSVLRCRNESIVGQQTTSIVRYQSTALVLQSVLSGQRGHVVNTRRRLCRSTSEVALGHAREESRTSRAKTSLDRHQRRAPSGELRENEHEQRGDALLYQPHRLLLRGEQAQPEDVRLGLSTRQCSFGFNDGGKRTGRCFQVMPTLLSVQLRCHACLCASEDDAKVLVDLLHHRLQDSLREYVREKHRRQISRLSISSSLNLTHLTSTDKTITEPPKRLLTRSQASNYRPSLARSMSNIGLGRMDDIEENDDELTSETTTTMSTSSRSSPTMELITAKFTELETDKRMKLYATALSDLL